MSRAATPRLQKVAYMQKIASHVGFEYEVPRDNSTRRFTNDELRDILEILDGSWPYEEVGLHPRQYDLMCAIADRCNFHYDGEMDSPRAFGKREIEAVYDALQEVDDGG